MTSSPKTFKFLRGAVTGRVPQGGYWNSDHNGVTSVLKVPRQKCAKRGKGKKSAGASAKKKQKKCVKKAK
jgi:hypothetical protein